MDGQLYIYNGTCPSKAAFDVYQLYIKTADGYCRDELQEESDGTYTIFTKLDFDDWIDYHYDLRFQKINGMIVKSVFMTAAEILKLKKETKYPVLIDNLLGDDDVSDIEEEDDLLCYEKLN